MTIGDSTSRIQHNPNPFPSTNDKNMLKILSEESGCASGFQHLESGYEYWTYTKDGILVGGTAYIQCSGRIIIPGLPIINEAHLSDFLHALQREFKGNRIMMVGVESEWLSQLEQTGLPIRHCLIGRQPEWHHHVNFDDAAFENIRRQLRRARNKDVQISHIDLNKGIPTPTIRAEIEGLLESWKATRTLDTIGFMVAPELNVTEKALRHLICARRNGVLVGLLSCLPTPGHNGWFLEDLIRAPEAPNGTIELLIAEAFTQLPHPPKPFITLGMVPLHDIEIFAQDNPSLNWVLNQCRVIGQRLVNLKGLAVFKARFRPDTWNTTCTLLRSTRNQI